MSLLLAGAAFKSGERIRGPFENSTLPDGSFSPSGDEWTAVQAAIATLGASGYAYAFDTDSLRATEAGSDGISSGPIGYANDWRAPDTASAATTTGDLRPTLTTISDVTAATFDGVDDELLWPFVDWAAGTLILVANMTDATAESQTLLEIGPLRLHAQFSGLTGPQVRVGGSVFNAFGLSSMLNRWTVLVVQFNRTANTLRLWHDGAGFWTDLSVASWDDNPHETWVRGLTSLLGRTSYVPTGGAPVKGGIHKFLALDTAAATAAQIQTFADWAVVDTDITATVPAYPGGSPELGGEELPDALRTVAVANQTQLDAAKAAAIPGDHIVLANGSYSLGDLTRDGTEANPIVFKAANKGQATMTALGAVSGDYNRLWGLNCGNNNFGNLTGDDFWVIRCTWSGASTGMRVRAKSPGFRAWYCEMSGNGRQIAFDTAADAGGAGKMGIEGHVKGCHFHDVAPGGANATETITVGFSNNRTFVESNTLIEDCLFEDCNLGGAEDETISVKSSRVTVRGCTFIRTRFCQGRHGQFQTFERCWHEDSGTGGFTMNDNGGRMISCKTVGGSRTEIFAGNCLSGSEDADWYTDTGTTPSGLYPRAHDCIIDHHDAVNTTPVIGKQFSTAFNPSRAAEGTLWRSNRGLTPNLGLHTNTTVGGTSNVAHVPPVKLTANDVGPNAAPAPATAAQLAANPFSSASAFHRPIGDGATYASDAHASRVAWVAVVPANNGQPGGGQIGAINQGNPFGVAAMYAAATDPQRTVRRRNCTDTADSTLNWDPGGNNVVIRIPDTNGINTVAGNQCYENTAFIVQSDYSTYEFFQTNRNGTDYRASICRVADVRGLGHGSALGDRVGVSASGCSVRMGMLSAAALLAEQEIGHALKLAIYTGTSPQTQQLLSRSIQWPACNADSFASNPGNNNGPFPYGAHVALKPDLDLDTLGLTTPQGYIIGRAMQKYGCYCMDDANGIVLRCDGSLGANATAIVDDYRKLLRHLYLITNSVTGATAEMTSGGSLTGSIGTATYPAGGGTALATNTALV